ncbi:MAG: S-layer homology domain-containing protein [bacterium]
MKLKNKAFALLTALFMCGTSSVYADTLDYGIFGGIIEGRSLPKTTELLLQGSSSGTDKLESTYKEVIFLSGVPTEFEGNITTTNSAMKDSMGTFKTTYTITPSDSTSEDASISRKLTYDVNYRTEGNQTVKDYTVSSWSETISVNGEDFVLDSNQSRSSISVLEDSTPGVDYYKGDISHRAVYVNGENKVTLDISGSIYGYDCAWSATESQRLNCIIDTGDWQMEYQIRPAVTMYKTIDYSKNEPTAISFDGNYQEIMQNKSGLNYTIYTLPVQFSLDVATTGSASIASFNTFEQLIAPKVEHLEGHFAEGDIKKLFAMEILDGVPEYYLPNQAISRGQFTEMLVKTIKLPIVDMNAKKSSFDVIFEDVVPNEDELYPYIMAAYQSGLVMGRGDGKYYLTDAITREEAIVILLRTLGLEHLGLSTTYLTSFVDSDNISDWAKKEVFAAQKIGIITGDQDGKFNPKDYITKAEAAAIVNRLIDYMRSDLQSSYTESIINYAD